MMRYSRNRNTITEEEQVKLSRARVCIVGCGGLGGYVLEQLGRIGLGHLTVIDGDVIEKSNLNRQLLSQMNLLGTLKVVAAKERMTRVNDEVEVIIKPLYITALNVEALLKDHDVVVDALDQLAARFLLQECCEKLNTPLVHGAIAGWMGHVATIYPGDSTLSQIYPKENGLGQEKKWGNPAFTPGLVGSIEVAEVIKILLNKEGILRKKMLVVNLLEQDYSVINF